ncbi:hypothetical protein LF1_13610 [Rubripirellula obstinata]|uniref:Peptidase M48 domain-containing protein n=1 Tax=Rubripirellula obstinata TaxID=406547 RepID=A0A5B1CCH9_9BACT|nr:hypothetical protein [Rubripirellula obstinata]KAA1258837.1 hypothetical protein LF1_13610 [Rubripirellula obstinata]
MTYARSRLWLGISGVGSLVLISTFLLATGLPLEWLPSSNVWSGADLLGLMSAMGCLVALMLPLDLLGGFLLPNRSRPNTITATAFMANWLRGVVVQATLFLFAGVTILAMGRSFGLIGASFAVLCIGLFHVAFQLRIGRLTASLPKHSGDHPTNDAVMSAALQRTAQWGWKPKPIVVLDHHDTGFTGGVVGLPGMESIVVPSASLSKLSPEQVAVTIARRLEAIQSGSRSRGMVLALGWVIIGFVLSAMLPGAGVTSVGELAMTCLGFTLWTFLGLLTLPSLSRQASHAIDRKVIDQGAAPETFSEAIKTLDRLQDDEPKRSKLIETIFHPVPSVDNRLNESASTFPIAWHAARMTLFVSWACMGMLVRAVHCNAGRPELWVMLPTD